MLAANVHTCRPSPRAQLWRSNPVTAVVPFICHVEATGMVADQALGPAQCPVFLLRQKHQRRQSCTNMGLQYLKEKDPILPWRRRAAAADGEL